MHYKFSFFSMTLRIPTNSKTSVVDRDPNTDMDWDPAIQVDLDPDPDPGFLLPKFHFITFNAM
jgi:hypothetical protein